MASEAASSPERSTATSNTMDTEHATSTSEAPEISNESTMSTGAEAATNPSVKASPAEAANNAMSRPEDEPRHCWICLQDENDDNSPQGRDWRSPCPCNLRAHESCMLDWIADIEANGRDKQAATKILCPQCKSEIHVARPWDPLVKLVDKAASLGRRLTLPAGLGAVVGMLWSGSMVYGHNAMHLVFGAKGVEEVLASGWTGMTMRQASAGSWHHHVQLLSRYTDPFLPYDGMGNWKISLGLPSIAPMLILSRTRLGNKVLPILPVFYFITHSDGRFLREWPPSAALSFALLPYLRSSYDALYERAFGKLEREWDHAVQRKPREGETAEQVAEAERARENEGGLLNIEIEVVDVDDEGNEIPVEAQEALRGPAPIVPEAMAAAPIAQQDGAPAVVPDAGPAQGQGAQAAALRNDAWELRHDLSSSSVGIVGALFFPAISSLMGDLLKHTLPRRFVERPIESGFYATKLLPANGLLQEKWARSLVGGCLFVVLKDALILYSKWRKAKNQGKRRVVDYVRRAEGRGWR